MYYIIKSSAKLSVTDPKNSFWIFKDCKMLRPVTASDDLFGYQLHFPSDKAFVVREAYILEEIEFFAKLFEVAYKIRCKKT